MEAILIALCSVTIPSWFAYRASKHAKNVDRKTETNHGKEPWEYLEMVLEVRDGQLGLRAALLDHQEQDAQNFEELKVLIKEQLK